MKTLLIIFTSFALSGCFYQTVNQHDLYKAVHVCGSVEKIAEISSLAIGREFVMCMNGMRTSLSSYEVKE